MAEVSYNGLEEAWSNEILPPNDEMQQLPDADSQEGGLKHAQQKQYLLIFLRCLLIDKKVKVFCVFVANLNMLVID